MPCVTADLAHYHFLGWVLPAADVLGEEICADQATCYIIAIPPVHVLVDMEVLFVTEYEDLAIEPLFEHVEDEMGPLEPLGPLYSGQKLRPALHITLQAPWSVFSMQPMVIVHVLNSLPSLT